MRVLVLSVLSLASCSALFEENSASLFNDFKVKFGRKYSSVDEENKRFAIFTESMKRVDAKNIANGHASFGVTKFSDKTFEEFSVLLGRKGHGKASTNVNVRKPKKMGVSSSSAVDWADYGKVTPVKNQGQCGSCWAFSAAEQVESAWAMAGNALWEFSPQQIASCTPGCLGCGGGDTTAAYDYINSTVGLGSAWFAPYIQSMYTACNGPRCTESCSSIPVSVLPTEVSLTGPYATVTGYDYATPPCTGPCTTQDLDTLSANVLEYGPVSVCVNAASWNDYTGGILTAAACGGMAYNDLDHCVQLTGLNATAGYWLVKNSWATNWGIDGYLHLEYGANTCGLADEATFVNLGNA